MVARPGYHRQPHPHKDMKQDLLVAAVGSRLRAGRLRGQWWLAGREVSYIGRHWLLGGCGGRFGGGPWGHELRWSGTVEWDSGVGQWSGTIKINKK